MITASTAGDTVNVSAKLMNSLCHWTTTVCMTNGRCVSAEGVESQPDRLTASGSSGSGVAGEYGRRRHAANGASGAVTSATVATACGLALVMLCDFCCSARTR